MKLYWVKFAEPGLGCGVTAIDEADCRILVEGDLLFASRSVASITEIRNFEEIDRDHVVPNMGNMFMRGIWFPKCI